MDTNKPIPTTCRFASTNALGNPRTGPTYNTKLAYRGQINSGNPVFVTVNNAAGTSPGYPDGFRDHAMTGVGYMFSTIDGDYIILHTTSTSDGDLYVALSASTLGDYAWCYFEK